MKTIQILIISITLVATAGCSRKKHYDKGFSVGPETETTDDKKIDGISRDSINIKTRPNSVLLTSYPEYRLTTIYKLNYDKKDDYYYTGNNNFYHY